MQDQENLIQREEDREMFGLPSDQGVGQHPVEPARKRHGHQALAATRHRARPSEPGPGRPLSLYSDKAILDAVDIATNRPH